MENALKICCGLLRTLKHFFESKVKRQLKVEHAMYSWLIAWTAEVMNKYKVRKHGKTSYEIITKHECRHQVFWRGERVLWQLTADKNSRDQLNTDFREGIFLGVIWRTTEYIIGTGEGIFKCATVKLAPRKVLMIPSALTIIVPHDQYILEGATLQGARLRFAESSNLVDNTTPMPRSGVEWALREVDPKPMDADGTLGQAGPQ